MLPQGSIDQLYWFCGSASQTIAAMYGLIMAAFVLLMENLTKEQVADPEKYEIITRLREQGASHVTRLSVWNGLAVLVSLVTIAANPYLKTLWLRDVVLAVNVTLAPWAIISSVLTSLRLFHPKACDMMAARLARELSSADRAPLSSVSTLEIIQTYTLIDTGMQLLVNTLRRKLDLPGVGSTLRENCAFLVSARVLEHSDNAVIQRIITARNLIAYSRNALPELLDAETLKAGRTCLEHVRTAVDALSVTEASAT